MGYGYYRSLVFRRRGPKYADAGRDVLVYGVRSYSLPLAHHTRSRESALG